MSPMEDLYENQTGAEAVAEMEQAFAAGRGYRTMHVPIEVEGRVLQLVDAAERARKAGASKSVRQVAETRKPYGRK